MLLCSQPPELFSSCKTETLYPSNNSTFISIFIFKSSLEMTYAFLWFITWYLRVVEIPRTGRSPKVSVQVDIWNHDAKRPSSGCHTPRILHRFLRQQWKVSGKVPWFRPRVTDTVEQPKVSQFRFSFLPLHLNVNCKSFKCVKNVEIIVPWSFMYAPLRVNN